jgi:hypothetical protein
MSGLQLQVLSNPGLGSFEGSSSPSFIIGNPQVDSRPQKPKKKKVAKKARKRENESMSKRRHRRKASVRKGHHRKRKNPFEDIFKNRKGKKVVVGPFLDDRELKKNRTAIKYLNKEIKALRKVASRTSLQDQLLKNKLEKFRGIQSEWKKGRKHLKEVKAQIAKLKATGWTREKRLKLSAEETLKRGMGARRRKVQALAGPASGFGEFEASLKRSKKSGSKKSKTSSRKARKKSSSKKHRARAGGKGRFGGWRIAGRQGQYMIMKGPGGKTKRYKIKPRGKAKKKKNPSRRHRHHRRHRKNPLRRHHRHHRKNPRGRRGRKRHGKKHHHGKRRRNPVGGTMGKVVNWLTAGDPREASFILAAAAVSEPLASMALSVPGLGSILTAVNSALSGVSPNAAAAIVPILPNLAVALALEGIGQATGKKAVQDFGRGLMITNIVDLGEAVGSLLSSAAGLSGVSYTPMGRHRRGMRGVDFTMSAVPRGLSAVPRGLGSYLPSPGGTLSTAADFGAVPRGMRGLTSRDNADFGDARQAADFGGVDFTMGAIPSMRGSHTGDVMYPDPTVDQDGNEDDTNESNDHTV